MRCARVRPDTTASGRISDFEERALRAFGLPERLARFLVGSRLAAPLAELLQLEAVPRVGLVLRGDVVTPLALLACECDRRSFVTCHRYLLNELIRFGCVPVIAT